MAQKNATPSKEQGRVLEMNGLQKHLWVVVRDLSNSLIIKHRVTGEFRVIGK